MDFLHAMLFLALINIPLYILALRWPDRSKRTQIVIEASSQEVAVYE